MAKNVAIIGVLLFALVVLFLCLRIAACVQARNEGIWVRFQIGLLHKTIKLRMGSEPAKKKQEPEHPEALREQSHKSSLPDKPGNLRMDGETAKEKPARELKQPQMPQEKPDKLRLPDLDWGDLICEWLSFLDDVKDRLRIDVLRVDLLLATGDAAKTGLYLGGLSALGGIIYPFLEKNFQIRDFGVQMDGDFEGNTTQYDLRFDCSFRPIRMIRVVLRHGRKLYHMVKQTQSVEAK